MDHDFLIFSHLKKKPGQKTKETNKSIPTTIAIVTLKPLKKSQVCRDNRLRQGAREELLELKMRRCKPSTNW